MRQPLIALLSSLLLCADAQAQPYEIKLDRPFQVGQKLVMFAHAEERIGEVLLLDGNDQESESTVDISLTANMTVLAVDDRGAITRAAFSVKSLDMVTVKADDDKTIKKPTKPLAEGARITAEWVNGKKKLSLENGAMPPELDRLLQWVLPVRGPRDLGYDDLIGTSKPQAEGDTWPANVENVSKLLASHGVTVPKGRIKGPGNEPAPPPMATLGRSSADSTRAETSLSLKNPQIDSLRGQTVIQASGAMTVGSVQSKKDPSAAPINQYVNWHASNTYVRGGVHRKLKVSRAWGTRFEPYHEPATGKPVKKKRR